MWTRALLVALGCACASALAPLVAGGDDSDCALYLAGPARSSAYDYSINLLKGNFGYDGQQTCITYEAVNQAYLEARQRILVSQPKGDWKAEDFASVGELVLDISINLARRYGLTYEEIEKGLPLIDTSRTLIREVCPPVFSHVECRAGKYRRLDGLCNNLQHPTWGAAMAPFQRLLSPLFADGINAPRIAHSGRDLPLSRVVSRTMHPDEGFHDHAGTVMVIAWGQFMDHDYTLTGTPLDPINRNDPEECCKRPPHLKHPYCNEIRIPDDDYFYRLFGVKCIDFVRGFPSPRPGCRLGSRVPFNTLTGVIDGNTVYGVTEKFARKLRTGFGGLLRMNPVFKEYGLKDLLPLKLDIPDEGCTRPNKNMYCFEAGEIRVNEQLVLTVMHTLMAREHNRVAHGLAEVNPHWDDETLYQEARRINIAEIQHITYNEFLPILLGKDVMEKFGLVLEKEGYWDGYDPEVNPDVLAAFAAAAYRFGHSLLPTAVERWSKAHKFIASKRLSDLIRRPYDLYRAGVLDEYVMGLMNQVAQAMDDSITQEVTNHLFKKVGARFGMDLVSFNMQRGREFGLPGYMEFRKFCGLPGAESFQDLFGTMTNHTVRKYESIFEHPVDVDLWSGGVSERPLPGSMLGPTFACIIATQFSYSRRGDRFWFELPNQPSSFTPEQLAEIRKSRMARVICDNTDIIDTVQLYPMVLPDHELNPRVPCRSGILPSMDFSKWAEPAPFHGTSKGFITEAYASRNVSDIVKSNIDQEECSKSNSQQLNCNLKETMAVKTNLTCNCNDTKAQIKALNSSITNNNFTDDSIIISNITNKTSDMDPNTVLKYVYNKKDMKNVPEKTTGHPKNSLRRKRSINSENLDGTKAPLIVNYETSHDLPRDVEIWLPARQTTDTVKPSALAHFHIETVHDNEHHGKTVDRPTIETVPVKDTNESLEREDSSKNNDSTSESNSEESNERSGENAYTSDENSTEENEKYINTNDNHNHDDASDEDKSISSAEAGESQKRPSHNSNDKLLYRVSDGNSAEAENLNKVYHTKKQESSEEEAKSQNDSKEEYPYKSKDRQAKLQDVDLGDYERIQVNKNGEVEPSVENYENTAFDPTRDIILPSTPDNELEKKSKIKPLQKENSESSSLESNDYNEPTRINDDEVKPVVEINAEVDSNEASEQNSSENLKSTLENESLETLTGVNEEDSREKNEKLQENKRASANDDVKQQFERIPLNYKHGDKKDSESKHESSAGVTNNEENAEDIKPRYDDKLNIKFHDLTIKLPEIKLPDDILSYPYENPPVYQQENEQPIKPNYDRDSLSYNKAENVQLEKPLHYRGSKKSSDGKYKPKFYHYSDEVEDEARSPVKEDTDEPETYNNDYIGGYYNRGNQNQDYRQGNKKNEEDDDLYEKFVRERFGKRGTFENRLEKLTDYKTHNPHLYDKVQTVLKKTKNVKSDAEKSGDPNAGFMWTLEYGEKL